VGKDTLGRNMWANTLKWLLEYKRRGKEKLEKKNVGHHLEMVTGV
jgi:hypothetical protein